MKTYDKSLKRIRSGNRNLIVDKSVVKDGHTLKIGNKYYVKIGKRLAELTLQNPLEWDKVKQEDITMIADPKGIVLSEQISKEELLYEEMCVGCQGEKSCHENCTYCDAFVERLEEDE